MKTANKNPIFNLLFWLSVFFIGIGAVVSLFNTSSGVFIMMLSFLVGVSVMRD